MKTTVFSYLPGRKDNEYLHVARAMNGYPPCLFVSDRSTECAVCFGIIKQAIACGQCGKSVCKGCMRDKCPLCNYEGSTIDNRTLQEQIFSRTVYCITRLQGEDLIITDQECCQWTGPLSDLDNHLCTDCQFALVNCLHKNILRCECEPMPRRELASYHLQQASHHNQLIRELKNQLEEAPSRKRARDEAAAGAAPAPAPIQAAQVQPIAAAQPAGQLAANEPEAEVKHGAAADYQEAAEDQEAADEEEAADEAEVEMPPPAPTVAADNDGDVASVCAKLHTLLSDADVSFAELEVQNAALTRLVSLLPVEADASAEAAEGRRLVRDTIGERIANLAQTVAQTSKARPTRGQPLRQDRAKLCQRIITRVYRLSQATIEL